MLKFILGFLLGAASLYCFACLWVNHPRRIAKAINSLREVEERLWKGSDKPVD